MDLNPRHRALLSHGQQGEALVVESKEKRVPYGSDYTRTGWDVTIRVKFADGSILDSKDWISAWDTDATTLPPGTIVPIRFDPKQRSRVLIDSIALRALRDAQRAEKAGRQAARDGAAVEEAEARLRPIDGPGS
jgi:hypothetical protein